MTDENLTQGSLFGMTPVLSLWGKAMFGKSALRCTTSTAVGALILTGCVNINAPEDAIVIELNINITQEVVYRLAADAGDTIEDNADIF